MSKISSISLLRYFQILFYSAGKRLAVNAERLWILSHDASGHETDNPADFILRHRVCASRRPEIAALISVRQTFEDPACALAGFAEAGDRIHESLGTFENTQQFTEMVRRDTDFLIRVHAFIWI